MKRLLIIGLIGLFSGNVFSDASQAPSNSSSPPPNSPMAPTSVPTPLNNGYNTNLPNPNATNYGSPGNQNMGGGTTGVNNGGAN